METPSAKNEAQTATHDPDADARGAEPTDALARKLVDQLFTDSQPWTHIVDDVMAKIPELLSSKGLPDAEITVVSDSIRHEVVRLTAIQLRTVAASVPEELAPLAKRIAAEVSNLEQYEAALASEVKRRDDEARHQASLSVARQNVWVPRAALAIACASLLWQVIQAIWGLHR